MSEKVLLVTGASSDVGAALIRRIAINYDKIVCHYRSSITVIEELQSEFGSKIIPYQADFADRDSTLHFAERIKTSSPTHFVHLSAIPNKNDKFIKTDWVDYEKHFTVQVHSAYVICRSILPNMSKNKHSKIIFMLTENVARDIPGKFAVPYTTAKYALMGLMKCLAAEYAEKGIAVNSVSPAMIETDYVSNLPELARNLNAEKSLLKRNLNVEDVVPAFEFLLSSGADAITGHNIRIGV